MAESRGYLLPAGEAYTEDMLCCFVFVPNKDEYRRAFFGSLDYFGTWLAWERDADKRGQDAARAWKLANEFTRECWEMGTCDLMIEKLDELIALQGGITCCPSPQYITYNDNRVETTTIVVGVGDAPDYYGETAVTDWDDWKQYVCYHAHVLVDDLINAANKIDSLLDTGIWALDAYLWMVRQIVFREGGWEIPIDLSWAGTIFKAILQGGAGYFEIIADDIEAGRDDIVCSLINGTSLRDAVESVIGEYLAWDLFYQFMDYDTAQAVIYNGGIDGIGYLTPIQREDCECEPESQQLIPNPDILDSCAGWSFLTPLPTFVCSGGDGGSAGFVNTTDTGAKLKSGTFVIPSGCTGLWGEIRQYDYGSRNQVAYLYLHRASDDVQVDFCYVGFNDGINNWHNKYATSDGPMTNFVVGTEYYIKYRQQTLPTGTSCNVSGIWLYTLEPEDWP